MCVREASGRGAANLDLGGVTAIKGFPLQLQEQGHQTLTSDFEMQVKWDGFFKLVLQVGF